MTIFKYGRGNNPPPMERPKGGPPAPQPSDLLTKLHDLHAPIRVPTISEYQYACGEAALEIERLRSENRELKDVSATYEKLMRAANLTGDKR